MDLTSVVGMITGVVGMITGATGLIISILNFRRDKLEALNQYFSQSRDKAFVEGKKIIYNSNSQEIEDMKIDIPKNVPDSIIEVINFYHHWGLMVKQRQLPTLLFYDKSGITASGYAVIRTYNRLKPLIESYRDNNSKYAEYYEFLYKKIIKHHPECAQLI